MWSELTPQQLQTLRRALVFAIVLAVGDVFLCAVLLWLGVIALPW